jgi:hypothetical protein
MEAGVCGSEDATCAGAAIGARQIDARGASDARGAGKSNPSGFSSNRGAARRSGNQGVMVGCALREGNEGADAQK